MKLIDALSALTSIYIIACTAWRVVCLFRKKGSCRFYRCPFRKNYMDCSDVYFFSSGCAKCPPTEEELEVYRRTPAGIVESLCKEKDG